MEWVLEADAKPDQWRVVDVHCEGRAGDILILEAFWTGATWRIIGNKHGLRHLRVTMWANKSD